MTGTEPSQKGTRLGEKSINPQRVLVPIDFSECSNKALQYAIAVATQFKGTITLLHVVPNVSAETRLAFDMPELQRALLQEGKEKVANAISQFPHEMVTIEPLVRKGVPYHEIVLAAKELQSDLIVIGTHGRTGLRHVLTGSTAERVVRHAPCPVLVVRECERDFVKS